MNADSITTLDGVVLVILLVAIARGAFIGMIRESFSIAALGTSCIALRYGNTFAAEWLVDVTGGEIGTGAAPFITGAVILIATASLVGLLGRSLKQGAAAVGLGWADRLGGGALGFAEGSLAAMLLVIAATFVLGDKNETIERSRSVGAVASIQEYVVTRYPEQVQALPDVAAPFKR